MLISQNHDAVKLECLMLLLIVISDELDMMLSFGDKTTSWVSGDTVSKYMKE